MDGLSPHGQTGDLNLVTGHSPEQPPFCQCVVVQRQFIAVHTCDLLGVQKDHGGLQPSVAIHADVGDFKILLKNRFHCQDLDCIKYWIPLLLLSLGKLQQRFLTDFVTIRSWPENVR